MSAERLRQAARQIRADWSCSNGGDCACMDEESRFHIAVADWLDRTATMHDELADLGLPREHLDPWAVAVANAYLGDDS